VMRRDRGRPEEPDEGSAVVIGSPRRHGEGRAAPRWGRLPEPFSCFELT
jgi:hypothetical protein